MQSLEMAQDVPQLIPNEDTVAAMKELDEGKGKRFESVESLLAELNGDE